jgi:hypothetical protein
VDGLHPAPRNELNVLTQHGTRPHLACCPHADPMRGFLGFAVILFYLILVVVPFLLVARFWPIVLLLAIIGGLVLLH